MANHIVLMHDAFTEYHKVHCENAIMAKRRTKSSMLSNQNKQVDLQKGCLRSRG